ncbi:FAD-binding oxidoreductase [Catellatospora bangladeshensis]|uniref:FAD-binding oxidoreductase n=1 Tax=Catellatospora bangladeshensis TaxID=310355 RepID=UPI0036199E7F
MWRLLSPANTPRADGTIEFHVRAQPGGELSPALVHQLREGDQVRLGAPVGRRLTLTPGGGRDLLLIAAGTGLAPCVRWPSRSRSRPARECRPGRCTCSWVRAACPTSTTCRRCAGWRPPTAG